MAEISQQQKDPASFGNNAEAYHLRLLTLQAELQDMLFVHAISHKEFRLRQKQLDFLSSKLNSIRASWDMQKSLNSYDALFPMPDPALCDGAELKICEQFLSARVKFLQKLLADSTKILNWIQTSALGRNFLFRTNFYLSGLRSKIGFVEGKIRECERVKKSHSALINQLERDELPARTAGKRSSLEVLREAFELVTSRCQRINHLQKEFQAERGRVTWMKRWLVFQEEKMASYRPYLPTPDPDDVRALSQDILNVVVESPYQKTEMVKSMGEQWT